MNIAGRSKRGIVLLLTLIVIGISVMYLAIIVGDLKTGMFFSGNFTQAERAYWAGITGQEYAMHKLLLNTNWMANNNAAQVQGQGVYVEEQYDAFGAKQPYTTHGIINDGESEFYIAFAEKGSAITPVKDKQSQYLAYYSYNNNDSTFEVEVPIDLAGKKRRLPSFSSYIIVEGRSGGAKSFVEAIYTIDYSPTLPSAAISSGDMDISLKDPDSKLLFTHQAGDSPTIRSNDRIVIQNDSSSTKVLDLSKGTAFAKSKIAINGMEVRRDNARDFGIKAEVPADSTSCFPKLTWEKLMEKYGDPANPGGSYGARLNAGVYAFVESQEKPGKYDLQYFRENKSKGVPFLFGGQGGGTGGGEDALGQLNLGVDGNGISIPKNGKGLDASEMTITTNTQTAVVPGEKTIIETITITDPESGEEEEIEVEKKIPIDSFALLAFDWDKDKNDYVPSVKGRPKLLLERNSDPKKQAAVCSNGMIYVEGELSGTGSVIAGQDIDFEAGSQLSPSSELGMAIYAKGDINIHDVTVNEGGAEPNKYIMDAIDNYIKGSGDYFKSTSTTAYNILHTYVDKDSTLYDILTGELKFTSQESQEMIAKILMKNSEHSGDGYKIIPPESSEFKGLESTDSVIKGVIYTWKNLNANISSGSLTIRGALVAYGGDPSSQPPGADSSGGKVSVADGRFVNVIYDPDYLGLLGIDGLNIKLRRVMFNRM